MAAILIGATAVVTAEGSHGRRRHEPPLAGYRSCRFQAFSHLLDSKAKVNPTISPDLAELCRSGRLSDAIDRLLLAGSAPRADAVSLVLRGCADRRELGLGRRVHHAVISPSPLLRRDPALANRLLAMYAACGAGADAASDCFAAIDYLGAARDIVHWNSLISALAKNALWDDALAAFLALMVDDGLVPDNFTLPCVLKACAVLADAEAGRQVHGVAVKLGLIADTFVNNALVNAYGKFGHVGDALKVFDRMLVRNLVTWNTIMSVFSDNKLHSSGVDLFMEMRNVGGGIEMLPDDATLATMLPMCTAGGWIELGRLLHGLAVKLGLAGELRINNALIDLYAKCGSLFDAGLLFSMAVQRNLVSWNSMISGHVRAGDAASAYNLLRDISEPDEVTVLNILPACTDHSELPKLKQIHCFVIRHGLDAKHALVPNALINAYSKCSALEYAERVFAGAEFETISLWNALIGGRVQSDPRGALELFLQMNIATGLQPDWFTIGSLLSACADLKLLSSGKAVHGYAVRHGLHTDSFIGISLLSMYMQCRHEPAAELVFEAMEAKDSVAWNVMINGYAQNERPDIALDLFCRMQSIGGLLPSAIGITSVLASCVQLAAVRLGKSAHCFAMKSGYTDDVFVTSSIIDMYAKCGCIDYAEAFFNRLADKDAVSYTVMITGYGVNGLATKALELYNEMESKGFKPDRFTYVGLLMACSHSGMVDEGLAFFEEMRQHNVEPKLEHYACIVDMLGRAGLVANAAALVDRMAEPPDAKILSTLLCACRVHGELELGERVAEQLLELEPDRPEHYVQVSNLFAGCANWEGVGRMWRRMRNAGLSKDPGCSWIDVRGRTYSFTAGNHGRTDYPGSDEVRAMWLALEEKIRRVGYVPDTSVVLHELEDDEEKVELLRWHSEKQAMAFGLLKTKGPAKLRVFKNIRVCRDCHSAAKLLSQVTSRDIVMRDNNRFHHFSHGSCSCGDYW